MLDITAGKEASLQTLLNSSKGLPQYIQFKFPQPVIPKRISITFQGGFVGTRCSVTTKVSDEADWTSWLYIYPEDVNGRQDFDLDGGTVNESGVTSIKVVFEQSSDFFGRVTVYDIRLLGTNCSKF